MAWVPSELVITTSGRTASSIANGTTRVIFMAAGGTGRLRRRHPPEPPVALVVRGRSADRLFPQPLHVAVEERHVRPAAVPERRRRVVAGGRGRVFGCQLLDLEGVRPPGRVVAVE